MNKILKPLLPIAIVSPWLLSVAGADEASKPLKPLKIVLVGDSTVAAKSGWGAAFGAMFKPAAKVVNMAHGGRSSRSYRDEGFWKTALEEKADYILIQFGHNDQPGKGAARETDPATTYPQLMGLYVDEARASGAKPVLITSVARRQFKDGKIVGEDLAPYAQAVRKLAGEKNVPLVDLHASSIAQLETIGSEAAAAYNYQGPDVDPNKPDRTHLSPIGAAATAQLVADNLQKFVPELKPYFATNLTVAADGSGDYQTVQEAVDSVPDNSAARFTIFIQPGVYKEHLVIPKSKINITLLGADAQITILTNDLHVKSLGEDGKEVGTIGSASSVVSAADFRAENLTFENTAPHVAQALAIYVQGDRAEFRKCRFLGYQDTIRVRKGRSYFEDCLITGRTDFIYGEATAWFERCQIHVTETGGWITAANTPQEQPYGLIFSNCLITGEPNVQEMLGRPWRPHAHTVWLNTRMSEVVNPLGWNNWSKPESEKTVRYEEYNSTTLDGKPVDISRRVAWAKQLSAEEAAQYTIDNVLGDWNPIVRPAIVLAGDSTVTDDAGWGGAFATLLRPGISLVNLARGGRSSRSFRDEGRWRQTLDLKPRYVLIQFGHNDEIGHGPERESDPALFQSNIARYVDEARAAGIAPILVTPFARRQWKGGVIKSSLAPYAQAVKAVAAGKNVPLVDLQARSIAFYEAQGQEKINTLSPPKENGKLDGTHLNAAGAQAIAPLVVSELEKAIPGWKGEFER